MQDSVRPFHGVLQTLFLLAFPFVIVCMSPVSPGRRVRSAPLSVHFIAKLIQFTTYLAAARRCPRLWTRHAIGNTGRREARRAEHPEGSRDRMAAAGNGSVGKRRKNSNPSKHTVSAACDVAVAVVS